jgi:carboxypeptidase family protein
MSRFFVSLFRQFAAIIAVVALASSLIIPAQAQSTSGTISGQVFDPTGKPLAGATVRIVNIGNGNARATTTDNNGFYQVPFLPPGIYSVTISFTGYGEGGYPEVAIELNKLNKVLPPVTLTQTPTAGAPTVPQPTASAGAGVERTSLVNSSDMARGGNFSRLQVESLPLGGTTDMRTFDEYALLLPGVAPPPYTPGIRGPGVGFGIGSAGQFSVNGARARSNNFTVDGSDNNDPDVGVRRQGFIILVPQSIESIQEFQISTLLWNAELGRNVGSQVNAVSKDGGNSFRGQVYGFFTDSSLNARNAFDFTGGASDGENPFTRTQAGIAAGGPLMRDRAQFFGSLEQDIVNTSVEQHFATPGSVERRFLGIPRFGVLNPFPSSNPLLVFDTLLGATPLGKNILSFYPLPNNPGGPYGANTFTQILPAYGDGTVLSFKVTGRINDANTLSARYNFSDDARVLPSVNRAIRSTVNSETRTQNLSLIFDTAISTSLFNQGRFSYGRTNLSLSEFAGNPLIFSAGSVETIGGLPAPVPSLTGPIGELIVEPFSPVGVDAFTFPQQRANNTFQFADSLSWKAGDHSVKLGTDIRRFQLNSRLDRNYRPRVIYGNGLIQLGALDQTNSSPPFPFVAGRGESLRLLSGVQLATIGLASSVFQTLTLDTPDPTIGLRFTEFNLFFNDNWRATSNFTLDYGLRYEYNGVPTEVNGRIERALALESLPQPGSSRADTPQRTAAFNAAVDAYRRVLDGRSKIYEPDRNNFGPHVGFAWALGEQARTAIRGGYGVYYDAILGAVVSQSRNVFPNEIPLNIAPGLLSFDVLTLNNPAFLQLIDGRNGAPINPPIPLIRPGTLNQIGGTPADFAAALGAFFAQRFAGNVALTDGGFAFTLPDKNLRTPYEQQWHMTLEQQLGNDYLVSAAYVGTKGTKLTRLTTPNLGPNVTPFIPVATGATVGGRPPVPFPSFFPPALVVGGAPFIPQRPVQALGPYQIFENSAASSYHALQLEGRKRYSRGYSFTASYTWSHAIDDVSDIFPIAGAPILPQDSFNYRLERANANYDISHRFSTSVVWDLPFYRGESGGVAAVLGGWQVTSIFQAHTGQPFTLIVPVDANFDGNLTDRPDTTDGLIFFEGHRQQKVQIAPGRDVPEFFTLGQSSPIGRNTVRGDSFINLDLAFNKNFRFTESQNLQFRAEVFNLLNRSNFGLPIRTLGSPGFGAAVETVNPARVVQFALKYSF